MGPSGIFLGLTQAELDSIRETALSQITSGRRTSISGGGKSGSKEWSLDVRDVLREVIYAEQQNGTRPPRVQKVVQILNEQFLPPYPDGAVY